MKKYISTILACIAFLNIQAQDQHNHDVIYNKNITPYHDALDAQQGINGVQYNMQAAWQNFVAQNPTWGARFDAYNGMPHRAFGAPISFGSGTNYATIATNFFQTKLAAYNLPVAELVALPIAEDTKYTNVNFKQVHQQKEVLFSRATMRFNKQGQIVLFGLDVHNNIPNLNATITPTQAKTFAQNAVVTPVINTSVKPDLKILPVPNGKNYTYHLVYDVMVNTQDTKEMPGAYYTLVDANTGEVLYRQNKVNSITHKVKGTMHPITWATPTVNVPLANLEVVQNGTTYHTDNAGNVTIPGVGPISADLRLQGYWCKVVDNSTGTIAPTYNTSLADGDSTLFDTLAANTAGTKVNAYYHVNKVHDFMKSKLPATFTDLDIQLLTRVDRTDGDCNAFYNGSSINFYYQGSGCASTAYLADVVYHEYGHGITNDFWFSNGLTFDNGAVGEGYSDMWAMGITDWPVIGPGFYAANGTGGIRQYNALPKVYPVDIVNEVHGDGEIIAGAWWDTRLNIGSLDTTSTIFAASHSGLANGPDGAEGQVFFDILIDALTYDDNDGNLNNGTPHFNQIVTAFAKHGIYLLNGTTVNHTPSISAIPQVGHPISANLQSDFPAFVGDVKVFFRARQFGINNPTDSLLCVNAGNGIYNATLPPAAAGTIYEYYYRIQDNNAVPVSYAPLNSRFAISSSQRNLPHLLPIGYGNNIVNEDFTNSPANWSIGTSTDNATAGKWIVATPISSTINNAIVQTGNDHTTGNGKCAVTGNATSSTSGAGNADVDNGRTVIITKSYNLSQMTNPMISYWRWYANSSSQTNPRKDFWRVMISNDGGNVWTNVERTYEPDVKWRRNVIRVKDYKDNLENIMLAFIATDSAVAGITGGTLVEAALDDFEITDLSAPTSVQDINSLEASVFPNPASNNVQVVLNNNAKNVNYKLVDVTGKVLLQNNIVNTNKFNINTTTIVKGIYFIHLIADGKQSAIKLTIVK